MDQSEIRGESAAQYPLSTRQTDPKGRDPKFVIALALRIKGELRADALEEALGDVVARQESMRTRLHYTAPDSYVGFMEILPPLPVPLPVRDIAVKPGLSHDEMAIDLLAELNQQTMEYTVTPSLRAVLHRFDDHDAVLTLMTNHLFSDGWSVDILRREIAACYKARVTGIPHALPAPAPYREFASWEQDFLQNERGAVARRFWAKKLAGAQFFTLPADHFHGPDTLPPRGSIANLSIDPGSFDKITATAAQSRCSAWNVFLAAFMVLAEKVTGQTDITLFTSNSGRPGREFYDTIGFFVNPVPVRLEFENCKSFRELMLLARKATAEARQYQIPFSAIFEIAPNLMGDAADARGVGAQGLMPIFNYINSPLAQDDTGFATSVEPVVMPEEEPSNFARGGFVWNFLVVPGEFRICIEYESDALDVSTIDRWGSQFIDLILAGTDNPDQAWKKL